ncbi:hypothetical protein EXIGLDRAFT_97738 [Exidia glandulosa HHB12029]|uniref:Uncharacterized protein n=1 Tax=Exidia glandulosa HHB12029 TaxID=1314781 RepID=A0A165H252_EXIGL|nr:hypothetical protein EXIGLDRAFT_97738 [Exidia glandulosa HHB12029]
MMAAHGRASREGARRRARPSASVADNLYGRSFPFRCRPSPAPLAQTSSPSSALATNSAATPLQHKTKCRLRKRGEGWQTSTSRMHDSMRRISGCNPHTVVALSRYLRYHEGPRVWQASLLACGSSRRSRSPVAQESNLHAPWGIIITVLRSPVQIVLASHALYLDTGIDSTVTE